MTHTMSAQTHRPPRIGLFAWLTGTVALVALAHGGIITAILLLAAAASFSPRARQLLGVPTVLGFPVGVVCFVLAFQAAEMGV